MKLKSRLKNGKFYVWKEKFAVLKAKKPFPNSFAVIKDKKETTAVIKQSEIGNNKNIIRISKNWKIITFDMLLPLDSVGFLATISKALAEEGISIFVVSAYSTDHILVKEKDVKKAINKLKNIGFALR